MGNAAVRGFRLRAVRSIVFAATMLATAATAAGVPALLAPPAGIADVACAAWVDDPFMGRVCPVGHGYLMMGPDGVTRFTHGADPIPRAPAAAATLPRPSADPACAQPGEPAIRVTIAKPKEGTDRYEDLLPKVRASVRYSSAIVLTEAAQFGSDIRLRVVCDAAGEIAVGREVLPTRWSSTTFSTIEWDLRAKGYGDLAHKELVFFDGSWAACNCGGWSQLWGDERPGPENLNNGGGLFSVVFIKNYGAEPQQNLAYLDEVTLHELGHNLGAVQLGAPHTSGAGHCNDGVDIMCYDDGGSTSDYSGTACLGSVVGGLGAPFDCHHDDYFHPFPPAGSYLATSWNVANNAFLERVDFGPALP